MASSRFLLCRLRYQHVDWWRIRGFVGDLAQMGIGHFLGEEKRRTAEAAKPHIRPSRSAGGRRPYPPDLLRFPPQTISSHNSNTPSPAPLRFSERFFRWHPTPRAPSPMAGWCPTRSRAGPAWLPRRTAPAFAQCRSDTRPRGHRMQRYRPSLPVRRSLRTSDPCPWMNSKNAASTLPISSRN